MFDDLYEDIGGKIKNWAKWIFIVEAICSVIAGIVLFTEAEYDEIYILYGLLAIFVGPFAAWVGSWILYAFGQLVEDVHVIRHKETYTEKPSIIRSVAPTTPVTPSTWVCTCGKVHQDYESSCICGVTKREAKAAQTATQSSVQKEVFNVGIEAGPGEWKCVCGRIHKNYDFACACGKTKTEAKLAQKG